MKLCGPAFVDGRLVNCGIDVKDGRIAKIERRCENRNVRGFILPAGVDIHVHFRDPGQAWKEDFYTGSLAAAFGGVSCVFDMPNTIPRVKNAAALREKMEIAARRSVVDFSIYAQAGVGCDKRLNVGAYKLYCTEDKPEEAIGIGDVVSFHCEKSELFDRNFEGAVNLIEHAKFRNERSEVESVREVSRLPVRKHIAHVSSVGSVMIAGGTKEVTPHHLLLDFDRINKRSARYKVNPPLRNSGSELLESLKRGNVDIIASDHAPHAMDEKENFESAPPGMPGVETTYPLMLSLVKREILSMNTLINAFCERPAELMGIRKGKIREGYDADLILVDFEDETSITGEELHSRCGWSAFEGFRGIFPHSLMIRGEWVVQDRELVCGKGYGKFVNQSEK